MSFSARERVGLEGDRLLHTDEGEQLKQVVLDDVARGADAVVVAGSTADADVLGHGDLYMVDVVAVPHRLVQLVGEAQGQDVLHRLLAEVVVDPEDRILREDLLDHVVELAGALEVVPERLLDDNAPPAALGWLGQAGAGELFAHHGEDVGRDREVERDVAERAPITLELVGDLDHVVERIVVVDIALHEPETARDLAPGGLAKRRARVVLHRVVHDLHEVLVGPVTPGEPDEREPGRQQPAVGQVIDSRHQLLACQVAGDSEDHERARAGDPRHPLVARIAQRVAAIHP